MAQAIAVLAVIMSLSDPVPAQVETVDCKAYEKIANTDAGPIPRELLKDWTAALGCLVKIVRDLKPSVTSVETASRKELLTAARAIRVILEENTASAIRRFRELDDVDVATVLAYGARIPGETTPNRDIRVNTTLILGNVIDNKTACVAIHHLLDPAIGTNGRANLLAVVSVVTPFALQENLDNIERMMAETKDRADRSLPDTLRIWTDLEAKVAARKEKLRTESRPADADRQLQQCIRYAAENAQKWQPHPVLRY